MKTVVLIIFKNMVTILVTDVIYKWRYDHYLHNLALLDVTSKYYWLSIMTTSTCLL